MVLKLKTTNNFKDLLCLHCSLQEEKEIKFFLETVKRLVEMKKISTEENGIFCFPKYKIKNNVDFFQLLFLLRKKLNITFYNNENDYWINNLLKLFFQYEINTKKQEWLYQGMIEQKLEQVKINDSQFKKQFQPKPFQIEHVQFALTCQRSANFSSPGAGKTIIAYMVATSLFAKQEIDTLVVVGPKSAKFAWLEEWRLVTGCISENHIFNFTDEGFNYLKEVDSTNFSQDKLNLVFVNFHKFQNDDFAENFLQFFQKRKFLLIIDEAHYMKNRKGTRHQNLSKLSRIVQYTLLLTGTPLPRFFKEGSYILAFLFPDVEISGLEEIDFTQSSEKTVLGGFANNFLRKNLIKRFKKFFVRENKKTLVAKKLLKPMYSQSVSIEVNECENFIMEKLRARGYEKSILDERVINKMNKALIIRRMQASSYPPLLQVPLDESVQELAGNIYAEDDQEEMKKELKIVANDQSLDEDIVKIITDSEMHTLINQYENNTKILERWRKAGTIINERKNERIIVWDVFKKSMRAFKVYLESLVQERAVFLINGDVVGRERDEIINSFKNIADAILIASSATIAESISFHKHVNCAIYLYKNYVGSHFMQSKDRIHRLVGENEPTFVKDIYLIEAKKPSIDQMIAANLGEKEKQQEQFID